MNNKKILLFGVIVLGSVFEGFYLQAATADFVAPTAEKKLIATPKPVIIAKPDYSVQIQKIKNKINKRKEECDRLRKELEKLNQALANLKSGSQNPVQASMSLCQESKVHLTSRLASLEQDRVQLKEQLLQALTQMRLLMDRIKQGKPVTIDVIQQQAPIAAAPLEELYVPAAQAAVVKKSAVKKAKKGKKAAKKKKVAKKSTGKKGAQKKSFKKLVKKVASKRPSSAQPKKAKNKNKIAKKKIQSKTTVKK